MLCLAPQFAPPFYADFLQADPIDYHPSSNGERSLMAAGLRCGCSAEGVWLCVYSCCAAAVFCSVLREHFSSPKPLVLSPVTALLRRTLLNGFGLPLHITKVGIRSLVEQSAYNTPHLDLKGTLVPAWIVSSIKFTLGFVWQPLVTGNGATLPLVVLVSRAGKRRLANEIEVIHSIKPSLLRFES